MFKFNAVIVIGLLLKFVTILNAIYYQQPKREETDGVIMYDGKDQITVENYMSNPLHTNLSWNRFLFYFWGQKGFNLNPFQPSCFSFKTDHNYEIKIYSDELDLKKLATFVIGISLFGCSDQLSQSPDFQFLFGTIIDIIKLHYLFLYYCGIITTSIITFTYHFVCRRSRLVKISMLGIFLLISVKNLLSLIFVSKFLKLIVSVPYTNVVFDVSFVLLFLGLFTSWRGCNFEPVTDPNIIELIAWFLKILGLVLIPLSTYFFKTALFIDVFLCFFYDDYLHRPVLRLPAALKQYFMPLNDRRHYRRHRR